MELSQLLAGHSCVGVVVGPLALFCCVKDRSQSGERCALRWSETMLNNGCPVQLMSALFTCATLLCVGFGASPSLLLNWLLSAPSSSSRLCVISFLEHCMSAYLY